jgi:hypothetical protein
LCTKTLRCALRKKAHAAVIAMLWAGAGKQKRHKTFRAR